MKVTDSTGVFDEKVFRAMCTNEKKAQGASLRAGSSLYEEKLWAIAHHQAVGCRFRRRVPVFGYLPALWCRSLRLAVDVTDPAADRGTLARRDSLLAEKGVTAISFSKLEIAMQPFACRVALSSIIQRLKGSYADSR